LKRCACDRVNPTTLQTTVGVVGLYLSVGRKRGDEEYQEGKKVLLTHCHLL
jgi:hypothetical protein